MIHKGKTVPEIHYTDGWSRMADVREMTPDPRSETSWLGGKLKSLRSAVKSLRN